MGLEKMKSYIITFLGLMVIATLTGCSQDPPSESMSTGHGNEAMENKEQYRALLTTVSQSGPGDFIPKDLIQSLANELLELEAALLLRDGNDLGITALIGKRRADDLNESEKYELVLRAVTALKLYSSTIHSDLPYQLTDNERKTVTDRNSAGEFKLDPRIDSHDQDEIVKFINSHKLIDPRIIRMEQTKPETISIDCGGNLSGPIYEATKVDGKWRIKLVGGWSS
jgi:hypothetical protein